MDKCANGFLDLAATHGTLHNNLCKFSRATSPGFAAVASRVGFTRFAINWRAILCDVNCYDTK